MSKLDIYSQLVIKRQNFNLADGLKNYSEVGYEIDHVDGWEAWYSCLDAEIMLIGQDFADCLTFVKDNGKIEPNDVDFIYPTNKNLRKLFSECLGIEIGHPNDLKKKGKLFFTNSIIGLKTKGGMQGVISKEWQEQSANEFLKPLIDLVSPKIIITLGTSSFNSVCSVLKEDIQEKIYKSKPLKFHVDKCYSTKAGVRIFPVYHCGSRGVNINRSFDKQKEDWVRIKRYL